MDIQSIIEKLQSYFKNQGDVITAYLFGSTVKSKARNISDVDIAVLFDGKRSTIYRFNRKLEIAGELEELLNARVDVVDLESADPFFLRQIMLNKILLVDKNIDKRVAFEVKKRREYFNMQPSYELYYSQALKRLEKKRSDIHRG